ncbi:MAG: glycosyltransferase family 2 protein [Planctomycetia bacterium]|nr:glycosyltransferase family 2 protein [Planctomycetia bacterium]
MALALPPDGIPSSAPVAQRWEQTLAPAPTRRASAASAQLSVVIVNFCQWMNTVRLVRQLRRAEVARDGSAEVMVIDNGSPAHPRAARLAQLRGVQVRRFDRNLGFAAAINRGCWQASGSWVLLLNPDVTVPDGFLDDVFDAIKRAELHPQIGVVGFRLLNRDGTIQASAGTFPTFSRTLAGVLLPRARRKCSVDPEDEPHMVEWVTGGCLLVRRDCFDQLGGLDESFFLYYEDVDFCLRAAETGWRVVFDPLLEVVHHWPLHARPVPPALRLITRHALLTYARKHWPRWQSRLLCGLVWAEASVRQLWSALCGQAEDTRLFAELRRLVSDVSADRDSAASERIRFAASFLEPVASAQDGRTG